MDVLVVSNYSGDKFYDDVPLGCQEIDTSSREALLKRYPEYSAAAAEMYTGIEHPYVKSAVTNLRAHADVSWKIVSAGYGLLDETDEIVAYDCSFSDIGPVQERAERFGYDDEELSQLEVRQVVAREIGIPSSLRIVLESGYDLAFLTLSTPYLIAVSKALQELPDNTTVFAIAANSAKSHIGEANWVPATEEVRAILGSNWYRIRGEILEMLSMQFNEETLWELVQEPATITSHLPG